MISKCRKSIGQYYTPASVARCLLSWVVRRSSDQLLDPACGDGQFLQHHQKITGIDSSAAACRESELRNPDATVCHADFFDWAGQTKDRFDAVVGNPPFIRYQQFNGGVREKALALAARQGANLSGLCSSWAPFVVVSSGLLRHGGRLAFVVPAEIGHAPYAAPVVEYLLSRFEFVSLIAVREKIFPDLSEDAWLLYADGYGGSSERIGLSLWSRFKSACARPRPDKWVGLQQWRRDGCRLRKHLLPDAILRHYQEAAAHSGVVCLGSLAQVSIGYVTGDNDFFHLRPSEAKALRLPRPLLRASVRNARQLDGRRVDRRAVQQWREADLEFLLLDLASVDDIPGSVRAYLDSDAGRRARERYKCRMRQPWYAVPDVRPSDAFLTYMNGRDPELLPNVAKCVCTNSLLAVRLRSKSRLARLIKAWRHPLSRLSQELEGHPLGGGMLKLEPGEAARVCIPMGSTAKLDLALLDEGIGLMRRWRHYA